MKSDLPPLNEFERDADGNPMGYALAFDGDPQIIIVGPTAISVRIKASKLGFVVEDPSRVRHVTVQVTKIPPP